MALIHIRQYQNLMPNLLNGYDDAEKRLSPLLNVLHNSADFADSPHHVQDFHEIKITLRVPRSARPPAETRPAESSSGSGGGEAGSAPETAVGVSGIELREQTHEEALLSTLGEPLQARAWPCMLTVPRAAAAAVRLTACSTHLLG